MTISGGAIFDDLPSQCPGCGAMDSPAENGPSKLMFLWMEHLNSYLCFGCKDNYTKWVSTNWADEIVKSTGLDLRETNKPKCVRNVEAIAAGEEPQYEKYVQQMNNAMGLGCYPPVP